MNHSSIIPAISHFLPIDAHTDISVRFRLIFTYIFSPSSFIMVRKEDA